MASGAPVAPLLPTLTVAITGAAGQLAYALYNPLLSGNVFGLDQPIYLKLLDVPSALDVLKGVVLELEDCAFPLLRGILATDLVHTCFQGADVVLMLGSAPRKPGQALRDLIHANAKTFRDQGEALEQSAKKTVKILVVGHPCNVNAMICRQYAPSIPASNFTSLTRLYQMRAQFQVAARLNRTVNHGSNSAKPKPSLSEDASSEPSFRESELWPFRPTDVYNVVAWSNHSETVFPDVSFATVVDAAAGKEVAVSSLLQHIVEDDLVQTIRQRGTAILDARQVSSGVSGAVAVVRHLHDWWHGSPQNRMVTMGVPSDGSYGVREGLIMSFPVTCAGKGEYRIVPNLKLSDQAAAALSAAVSDLESEISEATEFLHSSF